MTFACPVSTGSPLWLSTLVSNCMVPSSDACETWTTTSISSSTYTGRTKRMDCESQTTPGPGRRVARTRGLGDKDVRGRRAGRVIVAGDGITRDAADRDLDPNRVSSVRQGDATTLDNGNGLFAADHVDIGHRGSDLQKLEVELRGGDRLVFGNLTRSERRALVSGRRREPGWCAGLALFALFSRLLEVDV